MNKQTVDRNFNVYIDKKAYIPTPRTSRYLLGCDLDWISCAR